MRPEIGSVQAVHVTVELVAEVGVRESHGTREDISFLDGRTAGIFEGDDWVWDGNGLVGPVGTLMAGSGRGLGRSSACTLITGIKGESPVSTLIVGTETARGCSSVMSI